MAAPEEPARTQQRSRARRARKVDGCVARAEQLARVPVADRDLAWNVAAFYIGDLSALVTERLRRPAASA